MLHRTVLTAVRLFLAATVATSLPGRVAFASNGKPSIQGVILRDTNNAPLAIAHFESSPVLIVAFLGTECPLAKLYAQRLQELAQGLDSKQAAVIGVFSNCQDTIPEVRAFAQAHQIRFSVLKDLDCQLADALDAQRTPEIFVLDASRKVRYRGRIDDQYLVGVQRKEPKRADLKIAIDELLAGKPISVPDTPVAGCRIGRRPVPDESSPVTYSKQIAQLFQDHCTACHRPDDIGPFSLTSYEEVIGWANTIAEVVEQRRMPPWHADPNIGTFENDCSLSEAERTLVATWVAHGCPEGDRTDLPAAPPVVKGWRLSREPDRVVAMRDSPYPIAANANRNGLAYEQFWVDPGFTEDVWVREVEIRPGNRAVVHHITVNVQPDGKQDRAQAFRTGRTLAGFVPGNIQNKLPPGTARRIPAGAWFRFEVHYVPNGTAQQDLSQIGLIFADPKTITHEVLMCDVYNMALRLKPYADNQVFKCSTDPVPFDMELLSLTPHMHLRGKSAVFRIEGPDRPSKAVLSVSKFDFNWQTTYMLKDPLPLHRGERLQFTATYDNSAKNLANPDPSAAVSWGEQTSDEMFIGYFEVKIPVEHSAKIKFYRTLPFAVP